MSPLLHHQGTSAIPCGLAPVAKLGALKGLSKPAEPMAKAETVLPTALVTYRYEPLRDTTTFWGPLPVAKVGVLNCAILLFFVRPPLLK
jgi:hypothetical protein